MAQAAEAGAQVAAASAGLGPGASAGACAAMQQELPAVLAAAPKAVQADVQLALARALLASATEAQLREEPERCAPGRPPLGRLDEADKPRTSAVVSSHFFCRDTMANCAGICRESGAVHRNGGRCRAGAAVFALAVHG